MHAILVTNIDIDILWANQGVCEMAGCEPSDLIGRSLMDFLGQPEEGALKRRLEEASDTDRPVHHTALFRDGKGTEYTVQFEIRRVLDPETDDPAVFHISVGQQVSAQQVGEPQVPRTQDVLRETYQHSNLKFEDGKNIFERFETAVRAGDLYRSPDFSIDEAARIANTNSLYLSQVVNFFSGTSFPMYVNHLRVGYILRTLNDHPDTPISELWSEAGFGSYSSFNRYVKSVYGCNPGKLLDVAGGRTESKIASVVAA